MKTKGTLFGILLCFFFVNVSAQEKQLKRNTKQERVEVEKLATLLDSKTFEFIATRALPLSGSSKNLSGDSYTVTFSPDMIVSTLPFFGRAYTGIGMEKDKGMRFKGKPEGYSVEKSKGYLLKTTVKDGDTYKISLSVNNSGYARLTISSNDRQTISYQGEIVEIR